VCVSVIILKYVVLCGWSIGLVLFMLFDDVFKTKEEASVSSLSLSLSLSLFSSLSFFDQCLLKKMLAIVE